MASLVLYNEGEEGTKQKPSFFFFFWEKTCFLQIGVIKGRENDFCKSHWVHSMINRT